MEASEPEKDAVAMAIQSRIEAPLQWDAPPFARIIDLKEIHFDEVLSLIKHHFFREEPMCKASCLLDDVESVKSYLDLVRVWIKDSTSIVAVSSISGRVIGTAIARVNSVSDRTNTYSRVQIFLGKTLEKLMHLKSTLVKQADPYNVLNSETIFRIYIICVHPSYQRRGLGTALLEACVQVTASLKLPATVGSFTSGCSQRLATNTGFRVLSEIRYSHWIVDKRVVFDDPGIGNYSAAFMGIIIPEPEALEERRRARRSLYKKMTFQKCNRPTR